MKLFQHLAHLMALLGMDPQVLNKEGAVIEGLPVSLVPEGLLAAGRLLVVVVQRGEASKGAAALPTSVWLLATVDGLVSHQV